MQTKIQKELLNLIQRDRNGSIADTGSIRNTVNMLTELGSSVYEDVFEKPFLTYLTSYYRDEQYFAQYDCSVYLKNVEILLKEEKRMISSYCLEADTTVKIENMIQNEMIANFQIELVQMENSGLTNMMMAEKYEDLCRMYDLFRKVPRGLLAMSGCVASCVNNAFGQLLVYELKSSDEHVKFIESFLSTKIKYENIIRIGFRNDKSFEKLLNSLFRDFIVNTKRFSEILSLYIDDRISHNWQGLREKDIEVIMDNVMVLFRHLPEIDMFKNYYKQHLASRLLSIDLVSVDAERRMLLKLKTECGEKIVSDFGRMLIEFEKSVQITNDFYASRPSDTQDGPKLGVKLLRTGLWPIKSEGICSLPSEAIGLRDKFEDYYHQFNERRKLTWKPSMGDAELNATFSNGRKHELSVSAYQMCILMRFNNDDGCLTYTELEQATKIPAPDLKICLQSLSCVAGKNVLYKEPMSEDVREDDVFFFNSHFTSESYKIFLGSSVANKESEPEKNMSEAGVIERRKYAIDAAVGSIMKCQKFLKLDSIVREVEKRLHDHFPTDISLVKTRIDKLIEREYIKISDSDPTLYEYIP